MAGLYALWLVLRNVIGKISKFKVCAICATVVSTWVGLIVLKLIGYAINPIIIAILMGESITGFMYMLERTKNKKLLLMKPLVIFLGTLFAYIIITGV